MPEKKPEKPVMHGDERIDNYFWLNERDNPDVIAKSRGQGILRLHQPASGRMIRMSQGR